jgi:hypothetical protein
MDIHWITESDEDIIFLSNDKEEILMILFFFRGKHYIGSCYPGKSVDTDTMRTRWEVAAIIESNLEERKSG